LSFTLNLAILMAPRLFVGLLTAFNLILILETAGHDWNSLLKLCFLISAAWFVVLFLTFFFKSARRHQFLARYK